MFSWLPRTSGCTARDAFAAAAGGPATVQRLEERRLLSVSTFANPGAITAPALPSGSVPALPYPSSITVSGLTDQLILRVKVRLANVSHTFPDDLDILLVGPQGQNLVLMSDAGGSADVNNVTLLFDDGGVPLPDSGGFATGTYSPADYDAQESADVFPAPAPAPSAATQLSVFNGTNPNGLWRLFVIDDGAQDGGAIAGGWSLEIDSVAPAAPGSLIISEYRPQGPAGPLDEFVELYNPSGRSFAVTAADGSAGFAVASLDGTLFVVPNGTVIPARGHFLAANASPGGYSLNAVAAPDRTWTGIGIPTGEAGVWRGIALFRTSNPAAFTMANRLDAAGPLGETDPLYREGTGHVNYPPYNIPGTLFRNATAGAPRDSDSSAGDFLYAEAGGNTPASDNVQKLGAPGPENLASPVQINGALQVALLDEAVPNTAAPNRVRDFTSGFTSFGTVTVQRLFTNTTSTSITSLRFRIAGLTTFSSPLGTADLLAGDSQDAVVATSNGVVDVRGTTVERPPAEIFGGGYNATLRVPWIDTQPLRAGESIMIRFVFNLLQNGSYQFDLNAEGVLADLRAIARGDGPPVLSDTATAPPAPTTPDLLPASDTGLVNDDNVTRNRTPTFTGTAAPNSLVHVLNFGQVILGSATAGPDGRYSVTVTNPYWSAGDGGVPDAVSATATLDNVTSALSASLPIVIDDRPPAVAATPAFVFDSGPHRLAYKFNDDVFAAVSSGDLLLRNLTAGTTVAAGSMAVNFNAGRDAPTFTFPGYSGGVLPNGHYRATILHADVADLAGNVMVADHVFDFYVLAGDINRDRTVNGSDFAILAGSFGKTGRTYAQGDLNGDGSVNGSDFAILAGNFGKSVPAPAAAVTTSVTPAVTTAPRIATVATPAKRPAAPRRRPRLMRNRNL
jgi:subtilisin-like proprotein convertase family protein